MGRLGKSAQDEIVIRISADIQKLRSEVMAGIDSIKTLKRETDTTSQSLQGLDRVSRQISFQTMAQGLLNVSTASAQVFTSLSNLERVQYQVRASATAVERAEDQVSRKRLQLAQVTEKYGADSDKARMITNELATATDQLANKQDRLKLAQDNVNDTYILFASNIANTVFGSLQTMNMLLSTNSKAWIYNNLMTWNGIRATIAHNNAIRLSTAEMRIQNGMLALNSTGMSKVALSTSIASGATRGLSLAMNGLKIALGPIGLAFIGISAAMMAYETNFGGFKDAVDGFAKSLGLFKDELKDTGDGVADFGESMDDTAGMIERTMVTSLKDATKELFFYRLELKETIKEQMKFSHGDPSLLPGVRARPIGTRGPTQGNFWDRIGGSLFAFPSAYAETVPFYNATTYQSLTPDQRTRLTRYQQSPELTTFQQAVVDPLLLDNVFNVLKEGGFIQSMTQPSDLLDISRDDLHGLIRLYDQLRLTKDPSAFLKERIRVLNPPSHPSPEIRAALEYEKRLDKISEYDFVRRSLGNRGIMSDLEIFRSRISGMPKEAQRRMAISEFNRFAAPSVVPFRSDSPVWEKARELGLKNILIDGVAMSRFEQGKIGKAMAYSRGERGVDPMQLAGIEVGKESSFDQLFRYIVFKAQSKASGDKAFINMIGGVTLRPNGNVVIKNNTIRKLEQISESKQRTDIFLATGVDIGPVADSLTLESGLMTARFEGTLRGLGVSQQTFTSKGLMRSYFSPIGGQVPNMLPMYYSMFPSAKGDYNAQNIMSLIYNDPQNINKAARGLGLQATRYTGLVQDPGRGPTDPSSIYAQLNTAQAGRRDAAIAAALTYSESINTRDPSKNVAATPRHILEAARESDRIANEARRKQINPYNMGTSGGRVSMTINDLLSDIPAPLRGGPMGTSRSVILNNVQRLAASFAATRAELDKYGLSLPSETIMSPSFYKGRTQYIDNPNYMEQYNAVMSELARKKQAEYDRVTGIMSLTRSSREEVKRYEAEDMIDDVIRYHSRLAQISTGATIL